jgi:hypothetical protein
MVDHASVDSNGRSGRLRSHGLAGAQSCQRCHLCLVRHQSSDPSEVDSRLYIVATICGAVALRRASSSPLPINRLTCRPSRRTYIATSAPQRQLHLRQARLDPPGRPPARQQQQQWATGRAHGLWQGA